MIDLGLLPFATPRQALYIADLNSGMSFHSVSKKYGLSRDRVRMSLKALTQRAVVQGYSPDHDMRRTVPEPFIMKGLTQHYVYDEHTGERRLAQEWTKPRIEEQRLEAVIRAACEAMTQDISRAKPIKRPEVTSSALCNLYTFTDYHLGMAAWVQETGADWDLPIAERLIIDCFERMITAAPRAHTAVINQLGDFLHFDGLLPVTPKHHNVLDASGRYSQVVQAAVRVLRRLIDIALMKHAQVHVICAEGNHDESSSVWLRVMLSALYENEPRVTVDMTETPYYAFEWGTTMLGFHHGHLKKIEQLPLLFATRHAGMWGRTTKRYAHAGHEHHSYENELSGMKVIRHPTLAGADAYAARGGWDSEREATAITYHREFGQVGRTTVTPEMLEVA